eukprot:TRINITY_DN3146_c0_g1_i9.p1 TRINITY_DN3146_c0_g1~~TRINITY_DN3146_c0_g1_i9.p1  ORF type:complete len:245 (+),score=29.78 TRINITY_DN3146_c0_g1_i9:361-1095(+)
MLPERRLRILQEEYNSSLIEGKCVLATVGYFSMLFEKIIARWEIRYTVVLIKSGSMLTHSGDSHLSRWDDAREACEYLVEAMEPLAIDGMTLYMSSSSQVNKCTSLSCAEEVQELFRSVTFDELDEQIDMTVVLSQVFLDHFQHQQMEHVLVITDCEPLNFSRVSDVLIEGIRKLSSPDELSFTFMQVGQDHPADHFLCKLGDELTARITQGKFVDCITHNSYGGKPMCDIVKSYLSDSERKFQ